MIKTKKGVKPEILMCGYLEKVLLPPNSILSLNQIRLIFLQTLKDFFDEKIDIDALGFIAEKLYYEFATPNSFYLSPFGHNLGNALDDATEIDYYFKDKDENIKTKEIYEAQLKTLKEYYEANKRLLD